MLRCRSSERTVIASPSLRAVLCSNAAKMQFYFTQIDKSVQISLRNSTLESLESSLES